MQTSLDPTNPFGYNRYGFLWEVLRQRRGGHHLDYGAYDGQIIAELYRSGVIASGLGVDVNRAVVNASSGYMPKGVELRTVSKNTGVELEEATFDSASLLDVIEHVKDQHGILRQIFNALRPGGLFIVTVPRRHIFSFLDLGNLKFRLPRLHKLYYSLRHSPDAYRRRYAESPDGLVGDIEKEKGWHQHFTAAELRELLELAGFQVLAFDGTGFFARPLAILRYSSPGVIKSVWERLLQTDAQQFQSCNLFCIAKRPSGE